jgi:hypothetical protein
LGEISLTFDYFSGTDKESSEEIVDIHEMQADRNTPNCTQIEQEHRRSRAHQPQVEVREREGTEVLIISGLRAS